MAPLRKRLKIEHIIRDDEANGALSDGSTRSSSVEVTPPFEEFLSQNSSDDGHESGTSHTEHDDDGNDDSEADAAYEKTTASTIEGGRKRSLQQDADTNAHGQGDARRAPHHRINRAAVGGITTQVETLLQQVRTKHTRLEAEAEELLHSLRRTIDGIPSCGPFQLQDACHFLKRRKITIPFPYPQPPKDTNLKLSYAKPSSMNVVGSYPLRSQSRTRKVLHIDMVIQMPDSLFQEKDYTNYRYFYRRAFYLACLAAGIHAAHGRRLSLKYEYHHDDPLRPILRIRPGNQDEARVNSPPVRTWQINILPSISLGVFSSARLLPQKLSIRNMEDSLSEVQSAASNAAYNSSLRTDMLFTSYLKLLHQASTSCEAFRDACLLGSTWLRQRGFRAASQKGGFGGFEWTALVALLLKAGGPRGTPLLASHFTSIQIFKTVLKLLVIGDLVKHPLEIGSGTPLEAWRGNTGPVVWDALSAHNILYKTPVWSYRRLRAEAKTTLAMLNDTDYDGVDGSFWTRMGVHILSSDFVVRLKLSSLLHWHGTRNRASVIQDHYQQLKRGLGDRVSWINIESDCVSPWSISDRDRQEIQDCDLTISLLLDPKNAARPIDRGPPAEDKQASIQFREFWGDKAELRRFKDGTILEALVWDTSPGKPPIVKQVISHLLQSRYGVRVSDEVHFFHAEYDQLLGSRDVPPGLVSLESFKRLESDIRGLEAIPLPIRQIVLASTLEVTLNASNYRKKSSSAVDVVLQFESSARWPDDLSAIQRTKLAFLLQIGRLIEENVDGVRAVVGLENEGTEIQNQGFLHIVYPDVAAFHLRILHDREQTLLERVLKDNTINQRSSELAAQALARYKRDYLKSPAHTQAMIQFSSHFPIFKQTRDLLATWFTSHLLQNHVSAELIDLFAAHTFTQPWPWQAPTSVQTAFLRTIIWLARWDWRNEPLAVNLRVNGKMTTEERRNIHTRFAAWRKLDPAMNKITMFVASTVDTEGTTYSTDRPSKVVAARLTSLARAASAEIYAQDLQLSPSSLFSSVLTDFDFVLHLNQHYVDAAGRHKHKGQSFKNLELERSSDIVELGANPVQDFIMELEALYGSAILFMSGVPYRAVIGGLWTPQTAQRTWKMNLAFSSEPVQTANGIDARLNKTAILAEIARLGGELIEHVEVVGGK